MKRNPHKNIQHIITMESQYVGDKGKRANLKTGVSRKQHPKFSEKRTFLTSWYAHICVRIQGLSVFRKIWRFVFLKHPFWDSPFCLITDEYLRGFWKYQKAHMNHYFLINLILGIHSKQCLRSTFQGEINLWWYRFFPFHSPLYEKESVSINWKSARNQNYNLK